MSKFIKTYYYIERSNDSYFLFYLIEDHNNTPIIKIKKKIKCNNIKDGYYYGLHHVLKNIITLISLDEISKYSKILIYTNNKDIINKINNRKFFLQKDFEYINFFLDKLYEYDSNFITNVKTIINSYKKVSLELYIKCKKASKNYKKIIRRNSTILKLKKQLESSKEIIFFDFEMNCLENFNDVEIISIGAVKTDVNGNITSKFYSNIKPQNISTLTNKCIEITSLKQEDIDFADNFNSVFNKFEKWCGVKKQLFLYWGGNDIKVLKNDIIRNKSNISILKNILNHNLDFQEILCKDILKLENSLSLKNALLKYNIEFLGNQHNALYDSLNLSLLYLNSKNIINKK